MKKSGLLDPELLAAIATGPAERLPHSDLKDRGFGARFVVRTGEFTPYSNVIIVCGVPF